MIPQKNCGIAHSRIHLMHNESVACDLSFPIIYLAVSELLKYAVSVET